MTDAEGRFTFAGVPVGTRFMIIGNAMIGETRHRGSSAAVETKPGVIAVPDLVLEPVEPPKAPK